MKNSVLVSIVILCFSIFSATVAILYWIDPIVISNETPAYNPDSELELTAYGTQLVKIKKLSNQDASKAVKRLGELDSKFRVKQTPIQRAYHLLILRNAAKQNKDAELFKKYTQELSSLARKHQLHWLKAQLMVDKAVEYARHGEVPKGMITIKQAIHIAEKKHVLFLLPRAYNTAGFLSNASNQLVDAQQYFLRGIEVADQLSATLYNSKLHNNLGLLYVLIENWDKALEYILQARTLYLASGSNEPSVMQIFYLNEAYVYRSKGNAKLAEQAYLNSLKYYDEANTPPRNRLLNLKGLADIKLLTKHNQAAKQAAQACVALPSAEQFPYEYGQCFLVLSRVELAMGEYQAALKSVDRAIDMFSSVEHSRWLIRADRQKAKVYSALGDYQRALSMFETYYQQEKKQLLSKVVDLENAFAMRQIRQRVEILDMQNKLKASQLQKETLRFEVVSIWSAFSLAMLIFFIRKVFIVKKKNQELETLSFVDSLTGLNNRRYYHHQLDNGENVLCERKYRIVLFDVDDFKAVNDTHGHDVGDEVLIAMASRMSPLINHGELLTRWGGEEFLALLLDDENIIERIESIRAAISNEKFTTQVGELCITSSVGVSVAGTTQQILDNDMFFRKADNNLYEAKRTGKNNVVFPTAVQELLVAPIIENTYRK